MSNNKDNINHHIMLNRGTWWCNVTVRTEVTSERIRFSLKTKDVDKARKRRDRVFKGIMEHYTIASIKA